MGLPSMRCMPPRHPLHGFLHSGDRIGDIDIGDRATKVKLVPAIKFVPAMLQSRLSISSLVISSISTSAVKT